MMRASIVISIGALASACTSLASQTYNHDGDRFRIGYPATFTVRQEKGQAVFSSPTDRDVTIAIGIAPRSEKGRASDRSLASASQAALTMLRSFPDGKVISERNATIAGRPTHIIDLRFSHHGRSFIRRQFVIEAAEDIAYFGLTTPEERLRISEQIANAMLETLTVGGES